jgi:hypothetical protein
MKPKAYWVIDKDNVLAIERANRALPGSFRVIEKSAYDELEARADELVEALESLEGIDPCVTEICEKALAKYRGEK